MPNLESLSPSQALAFEQFVTDYLGRTAYPGLGKTFQQAVANMRHEVSHAFGTNIEPDPDALFPAKLDTLEQVAAHYHPLQGEFDADGKHLGGTGPTKINNEIQFYATTFDPDIFKIQQQGLLIKPKRSGGSYGVTCRADLKSTAPVGFTANMPGANVTTPIADLNLTASDMASVQVGDVLTAGPSGMSYVKSLDLANGNITYGALSGGTRSGYKGNWHLTHYSSYSVGALASTHTVQRGLSDQLLLQDPAPARVVLGMMAMACAANVYTGSAFNGKILSISADRRTIKFDKVIDFGRVMTGSTGDVVIFMPGLMSGQIASRRNYGLNVPGTRRWAFRWEFSVPAMKQLAPSVGATTRASIETLMAEAGTETFLGCWPAGWFFNKKSDDTGIGRNVIPGYRTNYNEIDLIELFVMLGRAGASELTCNFHDMSHTARRFLEATSIGAPGAPVSQLTARGIAGSWIEDNGAARLTTPSASRLRMNAPIADGTLKSVGIVQEPGRAIMYFNDRPVVEKFADFDNDYGLQFTGNLACGSLADSYTASCFVPQRESDINGQSLTQTRIDSWRF